MESLDHLGLGRPLCSIVYINNQLTQELAQCSSYTPWKSPSAKYIRDLVMWYHLVQNS